VLARLIQQRTGAVTLKNIGDLIMATTDSVGALPLSATRAKRTKNDLIAQQRRWGWIFMSPWIIGFLAFTLVPIVASLIFTFTNFNLGKSDPPQFIGLQNWQRLLKDSDLATSLGVTIKFALLALPIGIIIPIAMASLLQSKHLKLKRIWTTLFYMPYIVPAVSTAFVWKAFLAGDTGWLNRLLRLVGIANPPNWVLDANWIMPAFLMIGVWGVGNTMLITLASMQGVPTELYEAAQVDGADGWTQFARITLPMITPVIFYNLVLSVIGLMQFFTLPYVMTGGNSGTPGDPNKAALFINLYYYKTAFSYLDMGYGATIAWLIFIIGLAATALLFATAPLWVYYSSGD
jgi:multiple sugar transport system permease protein